MIGHELHRSGGFWSFLLSIDCHHQPLASWIIRPWMTDTRHGKVTGGKANDRFVDRSRSGKMTGRIGQPPHLAASTPREEKQLAHLDGEIRFDILISIESVIGDGACREINLIADDAGLPGRCQELRERTLPGLICPQRPDQCGLVEGRDIRRAGEQRCPLGHDWPGLSQIETLTRWQVPQIA